MKASTILLTGAVVAGVAGTAYVLSRAFSPKLPGAQPGSTGSSTNAGNGAAPGDWASQVGSLLGPAADAFASYQAQRDEDKAWGVEGIDWKWA